MGTNGIRRMKGNAKAKDVIDCVKRLRNTHEQTKVLRRQAERFCRSLEGLQQTAENIAKDTDEVVGLFTEMYHRLAVHVDKGAKEDRKRAREKEKEARFKLIESLQPQ